MNQLVGKSDNYVLYCAARQILPTAAAWYGLTGKANRIHYLDDFFLVGPPDQCTVSTGHATAPRAFQWPWIS